MSRQKGRKISRPGFNDKDWLPATVPGTVLTSYLNLGAVPDPYYADQRFQVSDAFFTANDFWYRDTLTVPASYTGRRVWLNFDGINWKADIFVNGTSVGHIAGAFIRGRFDITALVKPGQTCAVAVLIHKVAHPGEKIKQKSLTYCPPNGGILGLDSPTFVASLGWNWIPTIPGRNIGIWNDVSLSSTGAVSLVDPFVTTDLPLPDVSRADVTLKVDVQNHLAQARQGLLHRKHRHGEILLCQFRINAHETKTLVLDKTVCPQLSLRNPRLWWPNGMGRAKSLHDETCAVAGRPLGVT